MRRLLHCKEKITPWATLFACEDLIVIRLRTLNFPGKTEIF